MLTISTSNGLSEFLRYLAAHNNGESDNLPSMAELSRELGISVAGLREQLEVARALGLVEVRPRTGTRRLPYSFTPAVHQSLSYAIARDGQHFLRFADMRKHIELAYWHEAVTALNDEDKDDLKTLMQRAWDKLNGSPIQIPHEEHRQLHIVIFHRLDNPFVTGILEAYWDAYKAVGLDVYTDINYLKEVWHFHQQMVDAIINGEFEAGFNALKDHTDLIYHRPGEISR